MLSNPSVFSIQKFVPIIILEFLIPRVLPPFPFYTDVFHYTNLLHIILPQLIAWFHDPITHLSKHITMMSDNKRIMIFVWSLVGDNEGASLCYSFY